MSELRGKGGGVLDGFFWVRNWFELFVPKAGAECTSVDVHSAV